MSTSPKNTDIAKIHAGTTATARSRERQRYGRHFTRDLPKRVPFKYTPTEPYKYTFVEQREERKKEEVKFKFKFLQTAVVPYAWA